MRKGTWMPQEDFRTRLGREGLKSLMRDPRYLDGTHRWAPSTENNTEAYIDDVVQRTGFGRNEEIDVTDRTTLLKLIDAIIIHENGINPYRPEVFSDGVDRALR